MCFFSSKYKADIKIGTLGCSHSLVSVVLIVEGGGVNHHILNVILSAIFQVHALQGICCEICFLPEDRGQQWLIFISVNELLPAPQRDSARDNTGETILTSARDPTPARPACTRTQAQARQTGERSYANIDQLDCCAYVLYPYTFKVFSMHSSDNYVSSARVKHENIYNVGHLISGFSSVKAVRL